MGRVRFRASVTPSFRVMFSEMIKVKVRDKFRVRMRT
jgi:hypothetical protein